MGEAVAWSLSSDLIVAAIVAVAAGLMRGFSGFGSGMLMAPVFAVLFGPRDAVAMVIILDMAATLLLMPSAKAGADWRFIGFMGAVAALFMPLGLWLLVSVDAKVLTRAIGVLVVVFVVLLALGWRYRGAPRPITTAGVGALSGTMMAATSLGNPIVMLYLLSGNNSAAVNRSNITAYFAITLTALLLLLLAADLLSWSAVQRALWLTPIFVGVAWIGSRLFDPARETLYRVVALVFLSLAGVIGMLA